MSINPSGFDPEATKQARKREQIERAYKNWGEEIAKKEIAKKIKVHGENVFFTPRKDPFEGKNPFEGMVNINQKINQLHAHLNEFISEKEN